MLINSFVFSAPAGGWWTAGGATGCVQALQAKGAASYTASKLDLSGNGNNATEGTAPSWNASTGWTFNGSSHYLKTGIIVSGLAYSVLVRLANGGDGRIFGSGDGGGNFFSIYPAYGAGDCYFGNGNQDRLAGGQTSGVIGFSGLTAYVNGSSVGSITGGGSQSGIEVYLGSHNLSGSAGSFWAGDILAFALYNNTLDATKTAAVASAMAAL